MKKLLAVILVFTFLITTLAGCGGANAPQGQEPAKSSEPIKIGLVFPKSGSIALLGTQATNGAEIAHQIVNENGGVNGRQVEFVVADAPDPTAATTEAGRLIDQQGVGIIIGSLTSGNALAIGGVTEKNGAVLWETSGISDDVTGKGFKYVFRTCDKGGLRGVYSMRFIQEVLASKLGMDPKEIKVAIVNEDSSYGTSISKGAIEEAQKLGLNVVAHEAYNKNITDMTAMVLKVKAQKPDVIFAVSYVNDAVLLYDTLKQQNAVPKVLFGGGAGFTDPNFAKTEGADADGVFCVDMPANLPLDAFKNPDVKALVSDFRERYKKVDPQSEIVPLSAEAVFMGTYVLLHDVLPNAKSLSSDDIRAAALSTKLDETSMAWKVDIGEDGQNVGAFPAIQQWQGGKTVIVYPETIKAADIIKVPLK